MGRFSVGHAPSSTRVSALSWVNDTHIQDVACGMRLPPEAVVNCPQADIVGVLNQLEGMTRVQYCLPVLWSRLKVWVLQHPSPGSQSGISLMDTPMMSYTAMASSIKTTASSSAAGVPPPRYPPPGLPPLEPMDTLSGPHFRELVGHCWCR